jgi:hypothetical protein
VSAVRSWFAMGNGAPAATSGAAPAQSLRRAFVAIVRRIAAFVGAPFLLVLPRFRRRRRPTAVTSEAARVINGLSSASAIRSGRVGSVTVSVLDGFAGPVGAAVHVVAAPRDFGPRDHGLAITLLQALPGSKVLDLRQVDTISSELFRSLAKSWRASSDNVPRLAIVVAFDHWAIFRSVVAGCFRDRAGVIAELFYEQQAVSLGRWFSRGEVMHHPAAVVHALLRDHASPGEAPRLFTDTAHVALTCRSADRAERLAREALRLLGGISSAARCRALRVLGVALVAKGEITTGLMLLEDVITMASGLGAFGELSAALMHLGIYALERDDPELAEIRFRDALAEPVTDAELAASVHHHLAIALLRQSKDGAELHATIAASLRLDPESTPAQQDRALLAQIHERRGLLN